MSKVGGSCVGACKQHSITTRALFNFAVIQTRTSRSNEKIGIKTRYKTIKYDRESTERKMRSEPT